MSFGNILYTILIGPLQLFFEVIYTIANEFIGNPGLSIIVLSMIMNFLVLPLYKRADAMQAEERDIENKLRDGVAHIKKTFRGDERMMILQTYYRQNNYKPTDAIKGSISLFLEIPFFIAAYNFLSHLSCLQGTAFGPIPNLGAPDGLLTVMSYQINILPIIMTAVNLISCVIYTKGFPVKTKIQLYGMALFFLVFLYSSPAGLVFYWTLNNVFSLVKTIFYKLKDPKKVLAIMASMAGLVLAGFGIGGQIDSVKWRVFLIAIGILLQIPVIVRIKVIRNILENNNGKCQPDRKAFISGALFLAILVGALIPSSVINASPLEFVDTSYFFNPLWFIVNSLCIAVGTFLVWLSVFYWLADKKVKVVFEKVIWIACATMVINYMFFGNDLGVLDPNLVYENGLALSNREQLINLIILVLIVAVVIFAFAKIKKRVVVLVFICSLALGGMSAFNMVKIKGSVEEVKTKMEANSEMASFSLSKTGKNVIVLMMDRAMGEYVPYIMNEKPELKEQFDGFTYYSNVVSFGGVTNFASPAFYGGYEYTPFELNKRDTESLSSKQNEALKIMPVLFDENGYDVTVCDPTYANYQWIPDLSIYDEYPDIKKYITFGKYSDVESKLNNIESNKRNFFCFSLMKTMPLVVQSTIYDDGRYNSGNISEEVVYSGQEMNGTSKARGIAQKFMDPYNVLENLTNITKITDDEKDTFLMMSNDTTHNPILLSEPDYTPSMEIDNTEYDANNTDRFTVDGKTLKMEEETQVIHYHANMASFLQIGKWLDYLKENDVYDNTKIIIAADHGRPTFQLDELLLDDNRKESSDIAFFFPLLMVKDFNQKGFTTSDEFMTNADVPTLAMKDVIDNPVNPFTKKPINSDEKYGKDLYIFASCQWDTTINNGNVFFPDEWLSVKDNIWNKNNWKRLQTKSISPLEEIQ